MKHFDSDESPSENELELREIRESAEAGFVSPRYLIAMREIAGAIRTTKNTAARKLLRETMKSLESRGILSRMDSHHWDLGLCELESDGGVICAAEGYVLCFDEDEMRAFLYSPEEVRAIGGARY